MVVFGLRAWSDKFAHRQRISVRGQKRSLPIFGRSAQRLCVINTHRGMWKPLASAAHPGWQLICISNPIQLTPSGALSTFTPFQSDLD